MYRDDLQAAQARAERAEQELNRLKEKGEKSKTPRKIDWTYSVGFFVNLFLFILNICIGIVNYPQSAPSLLIAAPICLGFTIFSGVKMFRLLE